MFLQSRCFRCNIETIVLSSGESAAQKRQHCMPLKLACTVTTVNQIPHRYHTNLLHQQLTVLFFVVATNCFLLQVPCSGHPSEEAPSALEKYCSKNRETLVGCIKDVLLPGNICIDIAKHDSEH